MRVTLQTKLALTFGTVILLSAITAWLGISNLVLLSSARENVVGGPVERIQLAEDLNVDQLSAVRVDKSRILESETKRYVVRSAAPLRNGKTTAGGFALNLKSGGAGNLNAEFERM